MRILFILLINFYLFSTLNAHILDDLNKTTLTTTKATDSKFYMIKNSNFALSASKLCLDKEEKFTPRMTMDFTSESSDDFIYQVAYEGNFLILDMFVPKIYETNILNLYLGIKYKF